MSESNTQRRKNLLLAGATGVAFGLSFPPFRLGFVAYWALVPLFYLLEGKNGRQAVRWSYVAGFLAHLATLYWISWVTIPGALGALLVLPLFFVLYGLGHHWLASHLGPHFVYALPFLWTGIEYLRSLGQIGFPWLSLGYTQSYYTSLIQYASVTSVFGVSFWVAWLNVLIYLYLRAPGWKRRLVLILVMAVLFLLPWVHGRVVMRQYRETQEKIRLALIQGNIDPYRKWDSAFLDDNMSTYERLTEEALKSRPALIIWPETALPMYIRHEPRYLQWMYEHIGRWETPVLSGAPDYEYGEDGVLRTYNAAFLFEPGRADLQWYAKLQLVPFGERVPYQGALGWFKDLLDKLEMGQGDFSPGPGVRVFHLKAALSGSSAIRRVCLATVICYESIFPDLVRQFVLAGGQFLVVITNDGWFGRTSGPYQHERAAVFRAIETRRWIARCANTGLSCLIDPLGRVQKETDLYREAVVVGEVELRDEDTFYLRYGNVFTRAVTLGNVVPIALALGRHLRARAGAKALPV
ncbi:MAG: apolipoprotein N-acyltransferase [candidate division KSB1 bacterium]|nr:apolipoprotein N-acyltransferase [candidate division KSB1 bacterium]